MADMLDSVHPASHSGAHACAIARLASVVAWSSDDGGQTFVWSASPDYLLGGSMQPRHSREQMLGLFDANDRSRIRDELDHLAATGAGFSLGVAASAAGCRLRIIGERAQREIVDGRIFGVLQNVTQEYRTGLALLDSKARLDLALEAAGVGLWEWRLDSRELHWDPVTISMLGIRVNSLLDRPRRLWRKIGLAQARALRALPDQVRQSMAPVCGEISWFEQSVERCFRYRCRLLRGDSTHEDRIIGAIWEVTEERSREHQLEAHRERLRELVAAQTADVLRARDAEVDARQAQAAFFLNASHELRTPLHSMIGFTQLADEQLEELEPAQPARALLGKAEAAARKQLKLVDDLLDLAKLESSELVLSRNPASMKALVEDCLDEQRPMMAAKSICLTADLPDHDCRVCVDAPRLAQAVRNVISNAIRFTPSEGRIEVSLSMDVDAGKPLLRLRIQDSGVGIAPAELEAIFLRFRQGSRTSGIKGGTGLGLPIARQIVRAHGGQLVAQAVEGVGAAFVLEIPCEASPGA